LKSVLSTRIHEWARAKKTFGVDIENDFTDAEFSSWLKKFHRQIRWRFQRTQTSLADRADDIGLGRRSEARDNLLVDEDARVCNVTNARRLSRYHFEDLLRVQTETRLVLYLRLNQRSTNLAGPLLKKPFEGKPWDIALKQRTSGSAGDVVSLSGVKYLVVKVKMLHARAHHDAVSGQLTLGRAKDLFRKKEGFTLEYDGTDVAVSIGWCHIIDLASDLLVFGPPLDGTRLYSECFDDRGEKYCMRVCMHLAKETHGDVYASSALLLAFQDRILAIRSGEIERLKIADPTVDFHDSPKGDLYFRVFDKLCRRKLAASVCGFHDYNQPIISLAVIDDFVESAEHIFPNIWRHLSRWRNVRGDRHAEDAKNIQPRKREVFMLLLLLRRMRKGSLDI